MNMYCALKNKEECLENFGEYESKFFTGILCHDCAAKDFKSLDTCCNKPDVRIVNQPRKDGMPVKKELCFTCGNKKTVKMNYPGEASSLPTVTVEESDEITRLVDKRRQDFIDFAIKKREEIRSNEQEMFWNKYTSHLGSPEWKRLRAKVLNRDKGICQSCLENEATEVHHKTYANVFKEHAFELVSLCRDCHSRYHDKKKEEL